MQSAHSHALQPLTTCDWRSLGRARARSRRQPKAAHARRPPNRGQRAPAWRSAGQQAAARPAGPPDTCAACSRRCRRRLTAPGGQNAGRAVRHLPDKRHERGGVVHAARVRPRVPHALRGAGAGAQPAMPAVPGAGRACLAGAQPLHAALPCCNTHTPLCLPSHLPLPTPAPAASATTASASTAPATRPTAASSSSSATSRPARRRPRWPQRWATAAAAAAAVPLRTPPSWRSCRASCGTRTAASRR